MNEPLKIPSYIKITDLSQKISIPVVKIMGELLKNGLSVTINDTIDFETAEIIALEFGLKLEKETTSSSISEQHETVSSSKKLETRPPIVTIMGHVDHGKTSLLDFIRETKVAEKEAGGITQNITAYQVKTTVYNNERIITFIDTPGHKAFAKMREHGTNITDIVILVVAANDGVKPQTIEVIEYIKQNKVPVVVALNKIDAQGANQDAVKRQLSENGLVSEEWGGDTIIVPISAKTGEGINELLEHLVLLADELNLKANYQSEARGVVIESHQQKGLGPVSLILITDGVLEKNNYIIFNASRGKVRIMETTMGKQIDTGNPSQPIRIAGIKSLPEFGEFFYIVKTEKEAKNILEKTNYSQNSLIKSLEKEEDKKIIRFIVKAESKGTLEALIESIKNLENKQVKIVLTKIGIGNILDSDADLAYLTNSTLIAYRVKIQKASEKIIKLKNLSIYSSNIIYEILEKVAELVKLNTQVEYDEKNIGKLRILGLFYAKGSKQVIGGEIISGKAKNNALIKIQKDEQTYKGRIESLQIEKVVVDEVTEGYKCGMSIDIDYKMQNNDIIEIYEEIEKKEV